MALSGVADAGDGLEIWRIAANILNMQLRQPTRGGPPAGRLDEGANNSYHKNKTSYEMSQGASELDRFFCNDLGKGDWM
jgi:hypothetical protein